MNQYFAKRLYLIIIVVISIAIGFITGYVVGIKHQGGDSEQRKIPGLVPQGLQADRSASSEMRPPQDMRIPNQGGLNPQEPDKTDQIIENPKEMVKDIQEQKGPEGQGAIEKRLRQVPQKGIYTVQVGAFKNKKEAETLKTKLEKKGYNVYMYKEEKQKKGAGLFKVRIGDFDTKKEAEIFALKISKSEHLQAIALTK